VEWVAPAELRGGVVTRFINSNSASDHLIISNLRGEFLCNFSLVRCFGGMSRKRKQGRLPDGATLLDFYLSNFWATRLSISLIF